MEDHGYAIDIGIPDVTGFLPFKSVLETAGNAKRLPTGALVDVVVDKLRPDGRTCVLSAEPSSLRTSIVSPYRLSLQIIKTCSLAAKGFDKCHFPTPWNTCIHPGCWRLSVGAECADLRLTHGYTRRLSLASATIKS
jgi:hypothetical protein